MNVTLSPDYRPSAKDSFMNTHMLEYFRLKLLNWRTGLLDESNDTLQHLQEGGSLEPDFTDRASIETERSLELRTRDRARKLITKIDEALERIDKGAYGYCLETNEPICSIVALADTPTRTGTTRLTQPQSRISSVHPHAHGG